MREELAFLELEIVLHLQGDVELSATALVQVLLFLLRLFAAVRAVLRPLGRTRPHSLLVLVFGDLWIEWGRKESERWRIEEIKMRGIY